MSAVGLDPVAGKRQRTLVTPEGVELRLELATVGQRFGALVIDMLIITGVTQMFLAAVQIAGPLLVVLFLADAGLGLLTRVAPALNAFALGFPLKIFLTLTFASVLFVALPRIVSSLAGQAVTALTGVG